MPLIPACARILIAAKLAMRSHAAFGGRNGVLGPCRVWDGARSKGGKRPSSGYYGSIRIPGVPGGGVRAHVAAAWVAGLIDEPRVPDGFHIDHRCARSLCIEDRHFEIVPALENVKRRWSRKRPPAEGRV
jgi:hypothetical protein